MTHTSSNVFQARIRESIIRGKSRRREEPNKIVPRYGSSRNWQRGSPHKGRTGPVYRGILIANGATVAVRECRIKKGPILEEVMCRLLELQNMLHTGLIPIIDIERNEISQGEVVLTVLTEWDAGPTVADNRVSFGAIPEHIAKAYTTQLLTALEHIRGTDGHHGNVRSSTVHVDRSGVARVRDHGLRQVMRRITSASSSKEGRDLNSHHNPDRNPDRNPNPNPNPDWT